MSSVELQVLPIIVSILIGVSLRFARGLFDEAKEARSKIDSRAINSLQKLVSTVLREMEDDVERFCYLAEPPAGLGEGYHAHRRGNTAKDIAVMIWDGARKQKDLENVFNSWSICEEIGRFICGIGTFLNIGVLVFLLAIIIFKPNQIVMNNNYIWIVLSIIALPILCAFICYIVAFGYKRKFNNIRD